MYEQVYERLIREKSIEDNSIQLIIFKQRPLNNYVIE